MAIPNTCPNLSNIVYTVVELGRVIQTVGAADPGITGGQHLSTRATSLQQQSTRAAGAHECTERAQIVGPKEDREEQRER